MQVMLENLNLKLSHGLDLNLKLNPELDLNFKLSHGLDLNFKLSHELDFKFLSFNLNLKLSYELDLNCSISVSISKWAMNSISRSSISTHLNSTVICFRFGCRKSNCSKLIRHQCSHLFQPYFNSLKAWKFIKSRWKIAKGRIFLEKWVWRCSADF